MVGGLALSIWALVDVLQKPEWAWNYSGENRTTYIVLLAVSLAVCQPLGWVTAIMYFKAAKPRVVAVLANVPPPAPTYPAYGGYAGYPGSQPFGGAQPGYPPASSGPAGYPPTGSPSTGYPQGGSAPAGYPLGGFPQAPPPPDQGPATDQWWTAQPGQSGPAPSSPDGPKSGHDAPPSVPGSGHDSAQ